MCDTNINVKPPSRLIEINFINKTSVALLHNLRIVSVVVMGKVGHGSLITVE